MKQQSSSFVNPFRNIYSKVCFGVAGLSPKPFSRIDTLRHRREGSGESGAQSP
jgi:hypothetical protein